MNPNYPHNQHNQNVYVQPGTTGYVQPGTTGYVQPGTTYTTHGTHGTHVPSKKLI